MDILNTAEELKVLKENKHADLIKKIREQSNVIFTAEFSPFAEEKDLLRYYGELVTVSQKLGYGKFWSKLIDFGNDINLYYNKSQFNDMANFYLEFANLLEKEEK